MSDKNTNLELWNSVEKTDPNFTVKANIKGNKVTSIKPQYQIKNATEKFGVYGKDWGFKSLDLDYSLIDTPFKIDNIKKTGSYPKIIIEQLGGKQEMVMGIIVLKAIFFYPDGEFPIINSISIFTNNDMTKIDDNFAKKIETDTLTKALSKLGFNADIFLGMHDDIRYVNELKDEFTILPELLKGTPQWDNVVTLIKSSKIIQKQQLVKMYTISDVLMKELISMMKQVIEDAKPILKNETFEKAVVSKVATSIKQLLTTKKMSAEQRKSLTAQYNKLN